MWCVLAIYVVCSYDDPLPRMKHETLYLIGVVYNVTHFAKYHPGGKAQLKRGVGMDCTELFDKVK